MSYSKIRVVPPTTGTTIESRQDGSKTSNKHKERQVRRRKIRKKNVNGAETLKKKGIPHAITHPAQMASGFGKGYGMRTDPKNGLIISQTGNTDMGLGVGARNQKEDIF